MSLGVKEVIAPSWPTPPWHPDAVTTPATSGPPSPSVPPFPEGFVWGASTAAYQVEGAVDEDGRGRSVWDTFCQVPGTIVDGSSGETACDHYHRHAEDVALMHAAGLTGYRFSVAWPRVQPDGAGAVNPAGLAFYDALVDELLDAGIDPMVTLYHWDLPQALEDQGGWLARDTALRFADYAALVAERLGDRVRWWVPVNEPSVATLFGYALGIHAPGRQLLFGALPAAHHLLLAHGLGVQALRAAGATGVGCANNHSPIRVRSDAEADRAAAEAYDVITNRLFSDPVLLGRYPEGFDALMPGPVSDDLRVVAAPLDFYGVNYYNPTLVGAADPDVPQAGPNGVELPPELPFASFPIEGVPHTGFGWPVVPDGLRELLVGLRDRYRGRLPQVLVTENGCSYPDLPGADGEVHDAERIAYLAGHLQALHQAMDAGVDVGGYFTWSILDNFEWGEGFTQRFGLVHVDFATQVRTPKDSYHWYASVASGQRPAQAPPTHP
jgi:beta-glucosidase